MPKRKNMAPHPSHTDLDSCKGLGALQEPDDHQPEVDITDALSNPNLFSLPESHPSDADDDDDECFIRASAQKANFKAGAQALKSRSKKLLNSLTGGGSFQSLGLHPALLRAILLRGFSTPTPIQRAILPHILASPPRDVVGMARTGSGKTLAYLIPLIHNLGGFHSIKFGARALVMVPTRELAVQVLKVGKDLAKGFVQGAGSNNGAQDGQAGKAEGLRWGLVVGGDSLEDQFAMFASNPDVIIATPGRLLHLAVEMNLDLRSVTYVVFDEADRLFEMGFATQLQETLHRLPASRQTLLFSATLPKSLVEFAKAGLENPKLVRLDSEAKISADLQMAFLSVKPVEKEAALLVLIGDVIGVPKADGTEDSLEDYEPQSRSDRHHHRTGPNASKVRTKPTRELAPHQTIVFAATKHHVEYLGGILAAAGYRVSLIYGALDQAARRNQLNAFRAGRTSILVVTDLAARGLDIPILENVVNYDFPSSARAFVHRVGRTARAGRKGWAYSLVTRTELAYLMDLQLFLSRPLLTCPLAASKPDLSASLVLGTVPRERLDAETEYVRETLVQPNASLVALGAVVKRAQKMYEKSQSAASSESYRRAKALVAAGARLSGTSSEEGAVHVVFGGARRAETKQRTHRGVSRDALLAKVNAFSPAETVFEIGTRGKSPAAQLMRERRKSVGAVIKKTSEAAIEQARGAETGQDGEREGAQKECAKRDESGPVAATEGELEETFEMPRKRQKKDGGNFRDPSVYLGYEQAGAASERGYALHEGTAAGFAHEAGMATFDLGTNDEGRQSGMAAVQKASQTRWDRKTKKFVKIGQVGGDNVKLVKTESGAKLPASFRSGAYEEWKKKAKVKMPHVGDEETAGRGMFVGRRYRHEAGERRVGSAEEGRKEKVFKKTPDGKKKFVGPSHAVTRGGAGKKTSGKGKGRPGQHIRNGGLKTVQQIQKQRALKEKRTQRSNQPSRRKK